MTYSLRAFELHDMLRCGLAIRREARDAASLEAAAGAIVRHLYDSCRDPETGERECVLVRLYKTHPYGGLPADLREFARARFPSGTPGDEVRCLVLVATAGDRPEWNERRQSRDHQAIPLPSEEIVERAPMIAGLIRALGLEIGSVIRPASQEDQAEERTYNVFHVEAALGSPHIPAQADFVVPLGVRSVLGFGGLLIGGDLYAVILFSRADIPAASADRFRNIALDLRVALSAAAGGQTFDGPSAPTPWV